jgi:hypothetical protein
MMISLTGAAIMPYLKSRAAAQALGISYYQLFELIRSGKLTPPAKDASGDYVWDGKDLQRARRALKASRRRRQEVPA